MTPNSAGAPGGGYTPMQAPAAPAAAAQPTAPQSSGGGIWADIQNFFSPKPAAQPAPVAPAVSQSTAYTPMVSPTAQPKSGYTAMDTAPKSQPSPYFYQKNPDGSTIGASDQTDTMGKPLLAYRNAGDTSTTTDKTRVATTFNPLIPQVLSPDTFKNARDPNVTKLRSVMGAAYNQELDHKIALELSGSNDKSNLGPETAIDSSKPYSPGSNPTPTDALENSLAKDVASGKKSLFDAQTELAKAKGITPPWTPPPGNPGHSFWDSFKADVQNIFATPVDAETNSANQPPKPTIDASKAVPQNDLVPNVGTQKTAESTPATVSKDFVSLFGGTTKQQIPYAPAGTTQDVPGGYALGALVSAGTYLGMLPAKVGTLFAKNLYQIKTGKTLDLPFDQTRVGLSSDETSSGDAYVKAIDESGYNEYIHSGFANLTTNPKVAASQIVRGLGMGLKAAGTTAISDIFDAMGLEDILKAPADAVLDKTGFNPALTKSLGQLGLEAKDATAGGIQDAFTQRFSDIVENNGGKIANGKIVGTIPDSAKMELNQLGQATKTVVEASGGKGIPALSKFGQFMQNSARVFTDDVNGILKNEVERVLGSKPPRADNSLPGYVNAEPRPTVGSQELSVGASTRRVEPVGYGEKTAAPGAFKDDSDLTVKTLQKLEGKTAVSKQYISDLSKNQDLKGPERDVLTKVLSEYPDGKDVPVKEFAEKVQSELLPLDRTSASPNSNPRYEGITLPEGDRGNVSDYSEKLYSSPIKNSAGDIHFPDQGGYGTDSYFAHTRVEDLAPDSLQEGWKDLPAHERVHLAGEAAAKASADGNTRRVIELQSDLFQKGRLESESGANTKKIFEQQGGDVRDLSPEKIKSRDAEIAKLEPYRNTWHERVIREEIKQAAKDGKTKLQFPTGETAMKIEGLGSVNRFWVENETGRTRMRQMTESDIEAGKEVSMGGNGNPEKWIITDDLGDGKFKAVQKYDWDQATAHSKSFEDKLEDFRDSNFFSQEESFDISGKIDTGNPIYKFYESTVAKYLKKFGSKTITDAQGVTWNEINVPKEAAHQPVTAFKKAPVFSKLGNGPRVSLDEARKLIFADIPQKDVKVIFNDELIDGNALGMYSSPRATMRGILKPIIELYEENGMTSAHTAYHESAHYIFDNFLSDTERSDAISLAKKELGWYDKMKYRIDGYSKDQVYEEYLADKYAEQKTKGGAFKGPYKSFFEKLDAILKRISDTAKKVFDKIKKITGGDIEEGRQGGYIKNPIAETPEERLAAAKKVLEDAEKKRGVEPTEVGLSKKGDFAAREAANQKYISVEAKAAAEKAHADAIAEVKADPALEELKGRLAVLQETLDNHPAVGLIKYTNKATGELPEVTGEGNTIFGRHGDDMATELGFKDSEHARASVDEVRSLQRQIKDVQQEIQEKKLDIRDRVKAMGDEKVLGNMAEKSEKHISELLAKQERMLKTQRAAEEGSAKAKAEEEKKATLQDKISKAKTIADKQNSFLGKVKETFFPVRALDAQTQGIVLDWYRAKAEATEKAQATWKDMKTKGPQNFKAVTDYQAGNGTPYIREALDTLGTEAHRAGLSFEYRENYLPQVYRQNGASVMDAVRRRLADQGMKREEIEAYLNGQELSKDQSLRLKVRPNFVKERFFPDYKTAMKYGLTPKYNTPASLIAYYHEAMENSIANKNFIETLRSEAKLLPDEDRPDSWVHVSTRFTGRQTLYGPRPLANFLNGVYRDEENLSLGLRVLKGVSKTFHGIQHLVLSTGVPFSTLHSFGFGVGLAKPLTTAGGLIAEAPLRAVFGNFSGSLDKLREAGTMLKQSLAFFRANSTTLSNRFMEAHTDDLINMAREGIALPMRRDVYSRAIETYKKVLTDFKGDLTGPVPQAFKEGVLKGTGQTISTTGSAALRVWNKVFTEKTYDMIGQQTVQIFGDTLRAAKRSGFEDGEASKIAADVTRAFMGLAEVPESGRSKTLQESITAGFMAPFYREGVMNVLANAVKGSSNQWRNPSYSFPRALLVGAALSYVLYNLLNKKLNGYYLWDNPPGREFSLRIPNGNGAMYTEILPSVLTIPRNLMEGAIALAHGDIGTAEQKAASLASIPVSVAVEIAANKDYFGRAIYDPADTAKVKAQKISVFAFGNSTSPMINEMYKYFTGAEPLQEAILRGFAAPLKFSSAITENYNTVQKVYDNNQALKAAGKTDEANSIYDALPAGQKLIYDNIKRQATTAQTVRTKADMQTVYNRLQQMKQDGNTAGANAIYYGLSQREQHVYDLIKKADDKRTQESQ